MASNAFHNQLTGAELHYSKIAIISGPPGTVPTFIGECTFDSDNSLFYIAIGTGSVNDWHAIIGTGGDSNSIREISATSYSVLVTDNGTVLLLTSSSSRTINLIGTPVNGFAVTIFDQSGSSYTNPIVVNTTSTDKFFNSSGSTSYKISSNYSAFTFTYSNQGYWVITESFIGLQPSVTRLTGTYGGPLTLETLDTSTIDMNVNSTNPISVGSSGLIIKSANTIRFNNSGNSNYTSLQGGSNSGNVPLILPTTAPVAGQYLYAVDSSQLGWQATTTSLANIAANDSNVTFTSADNRFQNCLPTAPRTYTLPATGLSAGDTWTFYNRSSYAGNANPIAITLKAADNSIIGYCLPNGQTTIQTISTSTGVNTGWRVINSSSYSTSLYVPTVTAGSGFFGGATFSSQNVVYSQNGLVVTISGNFSFTGASGGGVGICFLNNIPFATQISNLCAGTVTVYNGSSPPVYNSGSMFSSSNLYLEFQTYSSTSVSSGQVSFSGSYIFA